MAAYISKKSSWLRCLLSFLPSAGVATLLCFLFAGPRLGPFYDFLLRRRPAPPISGELLIIDSSVPGQNLGDDILEPGTATSLLYTMTEFGAQTLIIQVPILGLPAGGNVGEAEILYRFDEEFSLLSKNIRNLFDGIRMGSVAPADSARYVGELVELSEKGKERLVAALVRRDEEGVNSMEKAATFFGHVRRPGDLRVQLIIAGEEGRPGVLVERDEYSRARPDGDGVLRRIAPVLPVPLLPEPSAEAGSRGSPPETERPAEHIIYGALKTRYETSEIQYIDLQGMEPYLVLILRNGPGGADTILPLDKTGAVLFDIPHNGEDFRRIGISDFLAYDEADRSLRRLLSEAEALGIYQGIDGEKRPGFLYDYTLSLREELVASATASSMTTSAMAVRNGDEEKKLAWIEARRNYFASLEDLLYGPTEMNLVAGYEEIIASELRYSNPEDPSPLGEAGIARIAEMRDSLIRIFVVLRNKYNEVLEIRNKLESVLAGSFCILGRASPFPAREAGFADPQLNGGGLFGNFKRIIVHSLRSTFYRSNPTDTEASALLANSILTGRVVKPGGDLYLLLSSLVWALLTCFFIKSLGPASTLVTGVFLILAIGAGFSWSFIFSGIWLDPLVPAAASATGVLVSFFWAIIARGRYSRRFRLAFGPFVSRPCLRSVIRAGRPLPSQTVTVRAAVVAVIKTDPLTPRDSMDPRASAQSTLVFQEKVSELFKKAGGTITGTEGNLVTACFGSPLERLFLESQKEASPYDDAIHALSAPALRAVSFVSEIAVRPECVSWRFGIDIGKCTFVWTAMSGYFAQGFPVRRARILSRLTARYKARIIISSSVNEALPDLVVRKLDTLKGMEGPGEEPFYRLTVNE